jgi:hypothetical protein
MMDLDSGSFQCPDLCCRTSEAVLPLLGRRAEPCTWCCNRYEGWLDCKEVARNRRRPLIREGFFLDRGSKGSHSALSAPLTASRSQLIAWL